MKKDSLDITLQERFKFYDHDKGMIYEDVPKWSPEGGSGYHSRLSGRVHKVRETTSFASLVYMLEKTDMMPYAERILKNVIAAQDKDVDSPTYGLWAYHFEENFKTMLAPDYNWANFIGNHLIYILKKRPQYIDESLKNEMLEAIKAAVICTLKRNVSPDYTNISMMSSVTLVGAAELLGDDDLMKKAKKRLKKIYDFNSFSGNFSEYNSPTYTFLAMEELVMLDNLCEEKECRQWVGELLRLEWKSVLGHYDKARHQLCPPHSRAYSNFIKSHFIEQWIYAGTDGEHGEMGDGNLRLFRMDVNLPDDMLKAATEPRTPSYIAETFYKENSIRSDDEDYVIIRYGDCPDLTAYSYITDDYSMGAFAKTDLWVQRRTNMIYWGKEDDVKCIRLRGMETDSDYSSAMSYSAMYNNTILGTAGFVTDHGKYHYILDNKYGSILKTNKLFFCFEASANSGKVEDIKITQEENKFVVSDGDIRIYINIIDAVFDGSKLIPQINGNRIEIVCYDDGREVDFAKVKDSYMVYTMSVGEEADVPSVSVADGYVAASVNKEDKKLDILSPSIPIRYIDALKTSVITVE